MLTPRSFSLRWQEENGFLTPHPFEKKRLWCVLMCALRVRFFLGGALSAFFVFVFVLLFCEASMR